jgi:hypothetical protein
MAVTNGLRGFHSFLLRWAAVLVLVTSSDTYANNSSVVSMIASSDLTQPSQVYNNFGLQWFIPYFIGITITCTAHKTPMLTTHSFFLHGNPRPHT